MKSVGLPISHKENEKRRALVPDDIRKLKHPEYVFVEYGYGDVLGYSDKDYLKAGANVCSREEVLRKEIICDPKVGDADYLNSLYNQTIFGWIHAVQNREITEKCVDGNLTVYAWEDMYQSGRHCFWRNNEIAGEAAVVHAYMCHGVFPFNTKAAVLGRGNTAKGAIKTLNYMGADVFQYSRETVSLLREEIGLYDVIVNAVLWDPLRNDHIIYREDLHNMKHNAMIIDISCDRAGGVETSVPTTIADPIYVVDGVTHYVVDHTPTLFWKTTSASISAVLSSYMDSLIEGNADANMTLRHAKIVEHGNILDERIELFQHRTK